MRWNKRRENPYVEKGFALLPIRIGDETRWLETVYMEMESSGCDDFTGKEFFEPIRFITKEEYEQRRYL